MPFRAIRQFEKSFPAIKDLTPRQKRVALDVFNSAKAQGDDDGTAIAKAIAAAKRKRKRFI